jgi:signal peptidase
MSEKTVKNEQAKRTDSEAQTKGNGRNGKKVSPLTIVGIVICVILIPILIVNVVLIVKGLANKNEVPTFGGRAPLIVLSDSMDPTIKKGDLIVVKRVDPSKVKEGDVIAFFDPSMGENAVTTHRVLKQNKTNADKLPEWHNPLNLPGIEGEGDSLFFRTQGDNNNADDKDPVPADRLVGVWTGFCWRGAGNVAMFMQKPIGLVLCIGVPVVLLVAYEIIRRRIYEKSKQRDTDDLLQELEELKKKQGGNAAEKAQGTADNAASDAQARAAELQAQLEALQAQLKAQQALAQQNAGETLPAADNDGQTS